LDGPRDNSNHEVQKLKISHIQIDGRLTRPERALAFSNFWPRAGETCTSIQAMIIPIPLVVPGRLQLLLVTQSPLK
jgi:hypothetical protein